MIGIYKITNNLNGRVYIGQSINIQKRLRDHGCKCLKWYIDKAICKYGRQNFTFDAIKNN